MGTTPGSKSGNGKEKTPCSGCLSAGGAVPFVGLHDFHWHSEIPRLRAIHWGWIVLAVCSGFLVYIIQAWRWQCLLKAAGQCRAVAHDSGQCYRPVREMRFAAEER